MLPQGLRARRTPEDMEAVRACLDGIEHNVPVTVEPTAAALLLPDTVPSGGGPAGASGVARRAGSARSALRRLERLSSSTSTLIRDPDGDVERPVFFLMRGNASFPCVPGDAHPGPERVDPPGPCAWGSI
jgi:hypothetical protein